MTSRERFLAALNGEKPDRPPLAHVSALTTVELQDQTGCFMPDAHLDAEQLARLCYANHEVLGFDAVTFIINFFNEPAALGVEMSWGAKNELPVYTSHPWREPDDAVVPDDILDRPPVSTYLEALRIAKRDYGDHVAVLGKVMGPLSMTHVMHGVDNTMIGAATEPEKIRQFIDLCVEVLVKCANAQFEVGIDAFAIGEGGAGANMMSPAMYEDLLLDVHRGMIARIDGPTIMHMCGDITPRLDSLAKIGLKCFNFDWDIEPKLMKQASEGKFTIMGNVNTTDLMQATPDVIQQQVAACLDAGVAIISPGCAVSPECPNANFVAMRSSVERRR